MEKITPHYVISIPEQEMVAGNGRRKWSQEIIDDKLYTNLDVLELEHISLYKGAPDLLVGPRNEKLVIVICLKNENR